MSPEQQYLEEVLCSFAQGRYISEQALPQSFRYAVNFRFCDCEGIYWTLPVVIPALHTAHSQITLVANTGAVMRFLPPHTELLVMMC